MEFQLTDEQKQLREEVRKFAEKEIKPVATEHDVEESYPHEIMDEAADMGLLAPHVPVEYGGIGYSSLENAILTEELFAADPGIGLYLVRSLVEIYRGDVRIEDNEPKGAVFVVNLPLCDG